MGGKEVSLSGKKLSGRGKAGDYRNGAGGTFLRLYAGGGGISPHPSGKRKTGGGAQFGCGKFFQHRKARYGIQRSVRGGRRRNLFRRKAEYTGKG